MSIPFGFEYLRNMALYIHKGLKQSYIKDYGKDLNNKYDRTDNTLYNERIFCLDCKGSGKLGYPDYKFCKGKCWKGCPIRAMAMKEMRVKKDRG